MSSAAKNIAQNIEKVIAAFHKGRELSREIKEHDFLNQSDKKFISVAFEGASSGIAKKALENENPDLNNWLTYAEKAGDMHASQIYVGMGWAIAEKGLDINVFLGKFSPLMQGKVLDGFGYYHGLLRRRRFIKGLALPDSISAEQLLAFDQGIGRSLWYTAKGDLDLLIKMQQNFPEERQKAIWRGIGLAAAYVGGLDKNLSEKLLKIAGKYKIQLATGAVLAANSRKASKTTTTDTELTCEIWA
ncbi:MAG: DUF1702 family protein, partial [Chitinophagales bacterium]